MSILQPQNALLLDVKDLVEEKYEKPYTLTSFIITIDEYVQTPIDIQNFIESGLRIIRIRMGVFSEKDKLILLEMLKVATKAFIDKFELSHWPIAVAFDIPNACIRTGCLSDNVEEGVYLEENSIVEITCDKKYWNKCDHRKIFIDDPYSFPLIKPETEITMCFGEIVMFCTEIVSSNTVKCKIARGSMLKDNVFVNIRGVKHKRPIFNTNDLHYLAFAVENKFDVIIVNCVRYPNTLAKVRKYFRDANCPVPLIAATICEQEGLDNIDEIIKEADFIVLAREFLAHEIMDKHLMIAIQLQISAKCKKEGVPLYVSGNVLEETLKLGIVSDSELADATNIIMQGGGLLLRNSMDPAHIIQAMNIIKSISKNVEVLETTKDFWNLCMGHMKPPVNAAEACVLACALEARRTKSSVIIIPTMTGKTAIQLAHLNPEALVLTVSINPAVARRLLVYRGIHPLIYDQVPQKDWNGDMLGRIEYAVVYAVKHDILKYGDMYVCLRKNAPTSSFCDCVTVSKVVSDMSKGKYRVKCEDRY